MNSYFEKRKTVRAVGSAKRPRLVVFRSRWNIHAQLVDDVNGTTLASAYSQYIPEVKGKKGREVASIVGRVLADRAIKAGCEKVVFDRAGFKYGGRIKALADGAREGGLCF